MRKASQPASGSDSLHDTVRIDRRNTVLAQIEAVLLADKLEIDPSILPRAGTDPYDSSAGKGITESTVWRSKRPR